MTSTNAPSTTSEVLGNKRVASNAITIYGGLCRQIAPSEAMASGSRGRSGTPSGVTVVSSGCDTGSGFPQVYAEMVPCLEIQAKAISPHKIVGCGLDEKLSTEVLLTGVPSRPMAIWDCHWNYYLSVTVPSINTGKTNAVADVDRMRFRAGEAEKSV